MNRRTKFLLSALIALTTAGTLYATVGKKYHQHRYARHKEWRHYYHCDDDGIKTEKNQQQKTDSTNKK